MTFKQVIRFTNDAGGLEKILRLLQALSQILAAYALTPEDAKIWLLLRQQFAIGRRYFRFFRFLDCFAKAFECLGSNTAIEATLGVGKWSCLGGYMFLESITLLDAMGVWVTPWTATCMLESHKFWFYSLVFSIILGILQLFSRLGLDQTSRGSPSKLDDKANDGSAPNSQSGSSTGDGMLRRMHHKRTKTRLLADGLDVLVPGFVTGWIPTSPAIVGFATAVSTVLSSRDIWDKLQGE